MLSNRPDKFSPRGRIVTFYSYKGGTGRSMSLINVGWIMASNGLSVLLIDWDLEAPGLNRYLSPFLADADLTSTKGVIDLLFNYMIEAITPQSASDTTRWYEKCADLSDYVSSVQHEFPDNGSLRLLGAGKQGPEYTRNVASFDWNNFYDRYSGGTFLEAVKYRIKTSYDYILIDCRTGITDLAGVCTVQLADDLVVCVSLKNRQSLEGAASVANSVTEQRRNSSFGDLRIFPVPARVELGEAALPDQAIEKAKRLFAPVTQHINNENYWNDVSVPYLPYFAFNEVPAPFVHERVGDELLKPAMRLTSYITDGRVSSFNPIPEDKQSR